MIFGKLEPVQPMSFFPPTMGFLLIADLHRGVSSCCGTQRTLWTFFDYPEADLWLGFCYLGFHRIHSNSIFLIIFVVFDAVLKHFRSFNRVGYCSFFTASTVSLMKLIHFFQTHCYYFEHNRRS